MDHFTLWISLLLILKTEAKRLNYGLRLELRLTNHCFASSLTSSATHRWFRRIFLFISELVKKWNDYRSSKLNLYLINLSCACKINRRVNQLWIQRSLSTKFGLSKPLSENDFTFWLIFGLRSNLGLRKSLSERLIQSVKVCRLIQPTSLEPIYDRLQTALLYWLQH